MDDQPLHGVRALITGAAEGIGAAIARVFAEQGSLVTLVDRNNAVEPLAEELGGQAFVGDVADAAFVHKVASTVQAIDVLVNNAGEVWPSGPFDPWDQALRDYDQLIGSNLRGAFLFGRAFAGHLVTAKQGNIINVSSDHVKPAPGSGWHHGHGAMDLYNASKWAVHGLTLDWAKALGPHGVRVNSLCMGATDTEMLRAWIGSDPDPAYVATWMSPERIGAVVADLVAEGPDGRTGDTIALWAGLPTVLPPVSDGRTGSSAANSHDH